MTIDTKFIDQFVKVSSKAALASSYLVGKKDKIAADKAAVDSMRSELNKIEMNGMVVIGEGSLDKAPMLYTGELLGSKKGPNFDIAVDLILSFTSSFDSAENTEIRNKLSDKTNYVKYYDRVPSQMDIERIVLKEMIAHDDSIRAIRAIPLSLRRFYIQAYQSFIFNQSLSAAFVDGENLFESQSGDVCYDSKSIIGKFKDGVEQYLSLPFVGYSYYKKTRFDHQISKILSQEEITPKDFFIKEMQEVSSEGGFRQAAIHCSDYSSENNNVEFSLSRGSFATILLREIMKPTDPINAGF